MELNIKLHNFQTAAFTFALSARTGQAWVAATQKQQFKAEESFRVRRERDTHHYNHVAGRARILSLNIEWSLKNSFLKTWSF